MSKFVSTYYPPRARWYSPVFHWRDTVRRHLMLDRIRLPRGITAWGFIGGCLVPGLAVYLRGPRLWGTAALAACGWLFLQFIIWLGHAWGNFAFGLMLSIHATGLVYYCSPLLIDTRLRYRLLFTAVVLITLGGLIYSPLRNTIQKHWLLPLQANGQVVVVQRQASANTVRRGDWIAYTLSGYVISVHGYGNAADHAGLGLGPVLAVAGDRVSFLTNAFAVNGRPRPLLPHMPVSGTVIVPGNHWFIWPDLAISGHGNVGEAAISDAMLRMADVSENQFVGKPFKRWFWRQQSLP
jgi:hypothetical protein